MNDDFSQSQTPLGGSNSFLFANGLAQGDRNNEVQDLQKYLLGLGYFQEGMSGIVDTDSLKLQKPNFIEGTFDEVTVKAVLRYQRFFDLPTTGKLDRETTKQMREPRCGNPDTTAFKILLANPWKKKELTFGFTNLDDSPEIDTLQEALAAFYEGFSIWSKYIPIDFRAAKQGVIPDIKISFGRPNCASYPHQACTSGPPNGDMIYADWIRWTRRSPTPNGCVDIVAFACHEVGHALGLSHTSSQSCMMYPTIYNNRRTLCSEDIARARAIYGQRLNVI